MVPALGSGPYSFHAGTQARGAAVAVWGVALSGYRAEDGGRAKKRRANYSDYLKFLRGCAICCVCPHTKGITQPHPKSARWEKMLHLLEATAKAKIEYFIDMPYVNKCNRRLRIQ